MHRRNVGNAAHHAGGIPRRMRGKLRHRRGKCRARILSRRSLASTPCDKAPRSRDPARCTASSSSPRLRSNTRSHNGCIHSRSGCRPRCSPNIFPGAYNFLSGCFLFLQSRLRCGQSHLAMLPSSLHCWGRAFHHGLKRFVSVNKAIRARVVPKLSPIACDAD